MKSRSCKFNVSVILVAVLVSAWSAAAEDTNLHVTMNMYADTTVGGGTNGIYVSSDAGLSILQNMTSPAGVIQYHVGPRLDVSAGYNLPRNIAVELQAGIAYNSWASQDNHSIAPGNSANVWAVPVMANGFYRYPFKRHWEAYGGLGAGVLISTLDISQAGGPFNFTSTDCTFGYQVMLGVRYLMADRLEWGVGYKFLGSLDHHWNGDSVGLTTSPTYIHSLLVSLTYRF